VSENQILVNLKKKRNLPLVLEKMEQYKDIKFSWLGNKNLIFKGATYS